MKVYKSNIWDYIGTVDAICITTNGYIKSNGAAVMGRGIAAEAKIRFPTLPKILGNKIKTYGNCVNYLTTINGTSIISFPVKRNEFNWLLESNESFPGFARKDLERVFSGKTIVPGWALKAEASIIKKSAEELVKMSDDNKWKVIFLTKPGCMNGALDWKNDVEPILDNLLDSRFFILTKSDE